MSTPSEYSDNDVLEPLFEDLCKDLRAFFQDSFHEHLNNSEFFVLNFYISKNTRQIKQEEYFKVHFNCQLRNLSNTYLNDLWAAHIISKKKKKKQNLENELELLSNVIYGYLEDFFEAKRSLTLPLDYQHYEMFGTTVALKGNITQPHLEVQADEFLNRHQKSLDNPIELEPLLFEGAKTAGLKKTK